MTVFFRSLSVPALMLLSSLGCTLAARDARADTSNRVVLLEPAGADQSVEVRARLRGELEAAGFEVTSVPLARGQDPKVVADRTGRELGASAVLTVAEFPESTGAPAAAEIWVSERLLQKSFLLRFELDPSAPGRDYARMAVQAVELLKANRVELAMLPPEPEPEPLPPPAIAEPEEAQPTPVPARSPERRGVGIELELGAGLWHGFQGLGAIWTPVLRAGASLPLGGVPFHVDVLASAAMFGETARIEATLGSATVRQSLALLELRGRFLPESVLQPLLSVSAGAYRVQVRGEAEVAELERSGGTWSFTSGAGAGLWLELAPGLALVAEGELLVAWARTVVRVAGRPVADVGSPMLLSSLCAGGVF